MRRLKADLIEEELGPGAAAVLRRVKTAVDPTSVLNPGALLPIDRR